MFFLQHKPDSGDVFGNFVADARDVGVLSKVAVLRYNNGGEFFGGDIGESHKQFGTKKLFTNADNPIQNGVVGRAPGIIQNARFVAFVQVPIIFPHVQLPPTKSLWADVVH